MKMKIDNGLRNSSKCEIYIKEIHIKDSVLNHAEMLQGDTPHDGIPQDSTESSTRLFLTWFGQTRFALSVLRYRHELEPVQADVRDALSGSDQSIAA